MGRSFREDYSTLYGQPITRAEWQKKQRDRRSRGYDTDPFQQPYHVGWRVSRDSTQIYEDEWRAVDSWTAEKIIRPSYSQNTTVRLKLHIMGKRFGKKRRLRAHRWYATVHFGSYSDSLTMRPGSEKRPKVSLSCTSVEDACLRAQRVPWLDDVVKALMRRALSSAQATCLFKKDEETGLYQPYCSLLGVHRDPMELPGGEYIEFKWGRQWRRNQEDEIVLRKSKLTRSYWGYSGGGYPEVEKICAEQGLETWIEKPEEEKPPVDEKGAVQIDLRDMAIL